MFKTKLIKMNQWPLKNKIRYRIKFKMMLRTAKTTLKKRWRRNGQFLLWNGQRKLLFSAAS